MKTYYTKTVFAAAIAASLMLGACSRNNETGDQAILLGSIATTATRAVPDTQIASGQQIGLFIAEDHATPTTTYTQNLAYTANGSGGLTGTVQYYPGSGNGVKISAYHPYNSAWTDGAQSYTFTVKADQSANADYFASDLLYSVEGQYARSKTAHNLVFGHVLSRITCELEPGDGLAARDLTGATVKIQGILPEVTVDLSDGTISAAAGAAVNIIPNNSYGAVVVPQTVAAGTQFIEVTLSTGGKLYYTIPAGGLTLTGGESTDFTITVNLTGITLTTSVTNWNNIPIGGGATMN